MGLGDWFWWVLGYERRQVEDPVNYDTLTGPGNCIFSIDET